MAKRLAGKVDGAWYDQGSTREAISYYQDYLILYPDDRYVARAEDGLRDMRNVHSKSRYLIGEFYFKKRNNPKAALVFLNDAITVAPQSAYAERAKGLIARIENGEKPTGTPIDWLFGAYKGPTYKADKKKAKAEKARKDDLKIK